MPVDLKSSTTEALKLQNMRSQIERQHAIALRELEDKHKDEIRRVTETQQEQLNTLKDAYDVQISKEAEQMEERLQDYRAETSDKIDEERKGGAIELERAKQINSQEIYEFQQNAEMRLNKLREQYQSAEQTVHNMAKQRVKDRKEIGTA